MPILHVYDGANLQKVQTLYEMITRFQRKFYERSTIYGVFFVGVFVLQASYLLVQVLLLEQKITADKEIYTLNAFVDASFFLIIFLHAIYTGGKANGLDEQVQKTLGKMKMDLFGSTMHIVNSGEFYRASATTAKAIEVFKRRSR